MAKKKVDIRKAQPGFKGRYAKWRIAWSSDPKKWAPTSDARGSDYRALQAVGKAGVIYTRGTKSDAERIARRFE